MLKSIQSYLNLMFQNMCTYARLITHCPQRDTSCYFSLVEVVRETKKTIAFL